MQEIKLSPWGEINIGAALEDNCLPKCPSRKPSNILTAKRPHPWDLICQKLHIIKKKKVKSLITLEG